HRTSAAALLVITAARWAGGEALQPIEWSTARDLANERWRIILAAGLTPENVARAVATAHPYAVDVNSGVEAQPGRKDPDKVWRVVTEAKGARGRKHSHTRAGTSAPSAAASAPGPPRPPSRRPHARGP